MIYLILTRAFTNRTNPRAFNEGALVWEKNLSNSFCTSLKWVIEIEWFVRIIRQECIPLSPPPSFREIKIMGESAILMALWKQGVVGIGCVYLCNTQTAVWVTLSETRGILFYGWTVTQLCKCCFTGIRNPNQIFGSTPCSWIHRKTQMQPEVKWV